MRQRASLDIIADDRPVLGLPDDGEADPEAAPQAQEDSRSTSSTSSPVPADNEESDFFLGANDSQSSLGVPNLQDIQVDDECLPPINRLPNEILIAIFIRLSSASDILHVMLTCKRWARNAVDILWHRPACTSWPKHASICQTLGVENPYFHYRDFIKRLNLASLNENVNDGSVMPLAVCSRVERLTLTGCKGLTDTGLIALVRNNTHLLALDISLDVQITEASINAIAENCRRLQGLNVSSCTKISNDSLINLAQNCRFIKRLKLNDCSQLMDEAVIAFAEHCPNILEIDLHQCRLIGNEPITRLLAKGQSLRELRLVGCERVDDTAFLSLPPNRTYEHLRILDLTSCSELTDRAVEKIIDVAPRLRNLVLAKCRRITDAAVYSIARLGKNLHYVHLGHCSAITDDAVKRLVQACNRIRYIDLGCCIHLTDESVTKLATLPKLKRIGLVKCGDITDESVLALARANQRSRPRRDAEGNIIPGETYSSHSSLERVHLSYCTNLTLSSILRLLNSCPRLTHLSLTGVQAFLRDDLEMYCRDAPPEFTEHQRSVFCVFSGQGVVGLRKYLNQEHAFNSLPPPPPPHRARPDGEAADNAGLVNAQAAAHAHNADGTFDDAEPDAVDDEDVLEDGSEMIIDTQPLLQNGQGASTAPLGGNPIFTAAPPHLQPLSAQAQSMTPMFNYVGGHPPYIPQQVRLDEPSTASGQANGTTGVGGSDRMEISSPYSSASNSASAGPANSSSHARPNGGGQGPVNGTSASATGPGAGTATNQARP
ncbi:SCF E3 ubiquitin ligase complex F-box protein grrA [Podospora aff. communis PSN243]|uniref:SCF E3 ubiquitin ligase complex F-box protein grrA n=1 Tax=Podospora aff. communis PSN243 TaxID=3040156 RepID=A0AAV9GFB3_9PEZI|nr:SCF E3 ubiquitin ligase complex F-box protein grrA [Podospora aff. communis PSN243]